MRLKKTIMLFLTAFILLPVIANAAAISFDELNQNENIKIDINDFEGGFFLNGTLVQQGTNSPYSALWQETADPISFMGTWIDLGLSQPINRTIYFLEPNTLDVISDIIHYSIAPNPFLPGLANIEGTFQSDTFTGSLGTLPPNVNPTDIYIEDGQFVSISAPFMGGQFRSDLDPVPEPASMLLLGSGLVGLLGPIIKRKRNS